MNTITKCKATNKPNQQYKQHFVEQIKYNIHNLNKSMENISKLIEQSQQLLEAHHQSNEVDQQISTNPLLKNNPRLKYSRISGSNKSLHKNKGINSQTKISHPNPPSSQSKQSHKIYHFSPQSINKPLSSKKKHLLFNPQSQPPKFSGSVKHRRVLSMGNEQKSKRDDSKQRIKSQIDPLLNMGSPLRTTNFKPLFSDEHDTRQDSYYLKKHITIKLFPQKNQRIQQQNQLNEVIRQRPFIVQPPFNIKAKQIEFSSLVKSKFIEKISEYKFVENYLTKNEIWAIYDKIVRQDIPELRWPIVIIDEVYKKMPNASS